MIIYLVWSHLIIIYHLFRIFFVKLPVRCQFYSMYAIIVILLLLH